MKEYDIFRNIDFGDIDGLYDKNLNEYFIDNDYWNQLVEGRKFFVIGRKGTGKSAIYNWIKTKEAEKNVLVSNLSFKNFPFEKLLKLTDDDFQKPNQYQSVWRNIILSEIAKLIVLDERNQVDDDYLNIKKYVRIKFGNDLEDLHKRVTTQSRKTDTGIYFKGSGAGLSSSEAIEYGDEMGNITMINSMLEHSIKNYLKRYQTNHYIIQFDQLDDNYTIYITNDSYFQSIISLFKVIYDINQSFYQIDVPVKVIGYLRSDIFYEINNFDAESARWDSCKLYLNWSIINRSDWRYPQLLKMLDRRAIRSFPELKKIESPFRWIFRNVTIPNGTGNPSKIFPYMVRKSFQRPRDLIQFCKKIQDDSNKWETLNSRNILDSEKSYSAWLLTEVSNEFGPRVQSKNLLYEFLRNLGDRILSYDEVCEIYVKEYENEMGITSDNILDLLYKLGIIFNVNVKQHNTEYFSIIRNEQSTFNRNMSIYLHPGIIKGLHVYSNQ